jgi:hypothetical protein
MANVFSSLITKIQNNNFSNLKLISSIADSLRQKHILVSINNLDEQVAISLNNWSSSLFDSRLSGPNFVNDYLGIFDANVSGEKNSFKIIKSISQNVQIQDDGNVLEDVVVNYNNSSNVDYKNYVQLVLASGASLNKILIDGKSQKIIEAIKNPAIYEKKNFSLQSGIEIDKSYQGQNTVYGFYINAPAGSSVKATVEYLLGKQFNFKNKDNIYSLKIIKQPGIDILDYNLSITVPENVTVINKNKELNNLNKNLNLFEKITEDKIYNFNFLAKN